MTPTRIAESFDTYLGAAVRRTMRCLVAGLGCVTMLVACDSDPTMLRMALPIEPVDAGIANELSTMLDSNAVVDIELIKGALSEEAALDAIEAGKADLALVSNNLAYRDGVATIMPLYPTVLHIGRRLGSAEELGPEALRGKTIFAGPPGSASRKVFERITTHQGLEPGDFRFSDGFEDVPDVFVLFAPIAPLRIRELESLGAVLSDFELASIGTPADIGSGGLVDAAVLMNPNFRPFVIPGGTYGPLTQEPIATIAVDKMLVTRSNLDPALVYDLINEILRLRPALAARQPGLFRRLNGDFDTSRSTFVVHAGAQAWLQRAAPSIYERYSGVAEVVVTLIVALASASIAIVRFIRFRRKNRIDRFYVQAIELRRLADAESSPDAREQIATNVRDLQDQAFDMLVDEKLAADESFRIFITLSNNILQQLGAADRNSIGDQ